jgi:hypothetical protein
MNKKLELLKKHYIEAETRENILDIEELFISVGAKKGEGTPNTSYPYRYINDKNKTEGCCCITPTNRTPITLEKARKLVEEETIGVYTAHEVDFAYLIGVFNSGGIDALVKETARLIEIGKQPHEIIIAGRLQK